MMPGDPVQTMAMGYVRDEGLDYATAYERAKAELGYDPSLPLGQQYVAYMKNLLSGNLGESMVYNKPVSEIIRAALPWTLFIFSTALLLSFAIGIAVGMYTAWRRQTILDPALSVFASITARSPTTSWPSFSS